MISALQGCWVGLGNPGAVPIQGQVTALGTKAHAGIDLGAHAQLVCAYIKYIYGVGGGGGRSLNPLERKIQIWHVWLKFKIHPLPDFGNFFFFN